MFGANYNDHRASLGYAAKPMTEADLFFYKNATWAQQFAWCPHQCKLTKKIIWLKNAYKGTARYRAGDFDVVSEYGWHDRHEHLFWVLKGPYG